MADWNAAAAGLKADSVRVDLKTVEQAVGRRAHFVAGSVHLDFVVVG